MHEGLGEVAAHLVLGGVVFLAEQLRRSAGGAGAFEPSAGGEVIALLVGGEGHEESAEQEGAFGVAEGPGVLAEAVGVSGLGEVTGLKVIPEVRPSRITGRPLVNTCNTAARTAKRNAPLTPRQTRMRSWNWTRNN